MHYNECSLILAVDVALSAAAAQIMETMASVDEFDLSLIVRNFSLFGFLKKFNVKFKVI